MFNRFLNRTTSDPLWIFCDGSSGANGRAETAADLLPLGVTAAAAAVAHRADGAIIDWAWQALPDLANNKAEYAGLMVGLDIAQPLQTRQASVVLDSDVVVGQMEGRFAVNSANLRRWHQRACAALRSLPAARFYAVPRSWNRLADGLAGQAGFPWPRLLQAIERRAEVFHA